MFTGIVETIGTIVRRQVGGGSGEFTVRPAVPISDLQYGESIAVNGVCLTLESWKNNILVFHVLEETLKRTNLGILPLRSTVNIERAMRFGDRVGGHLMSGHIDAAAPVLDVKPAAGDIEMSVRLPPSLNPWLVEKGSIAIDGVSLTLVEIGTDRFSVHLIPVTWKDTALAARKPGELVNLEADLLGKYVQRQLHLLDPSKSGRPGSVTLDSLHNAGW